MWLVGIPLIAYLAVLSSLYVFQRQLLYFPDKSRPQLAGLAQLGVREIRLTTADGLSLFSWYLPPREGRPVILYFHGNGGNIGYRADRMQRFAREGYGVLMLEYRGYGGNPGTPTEAGLYDDARAGLDFLQREAIAADRLVLYGESLGSGSCGTYGGTAAGRRADPRIAVYQRRRGRPIPLPLRARRPLDLGPLRFAVADRPGDVRPS